MANSIHWVITIVCSL